MAFLVLFVVMYPVIEGCFIFNFGLLLVFGFIVGFLFLVCLLSCLSFCVGVLVSCSLGCLRFTFNFWSSLSGLFPYFFVILFVVSSKLFVIDGAHFEKKTSQIKTTIKMKITS